MRKSKSLNWLLYLVISCSIYHISKAEVHRFDCPQCLHDNQLKLGLVLMDCYGYDTLYSWLEKDYGILLICNVDSDGEIKKISQIRRRLSPGKRDRILENDTSKILKIFHQRNIKLDLCYGSDWYKFSDEQTRLWLAQNQEFPVLTDVAFPGFLYISTGTYDKDSSIRAKSLLNLIKEEYELFYDSIQIDTLRSD